MNFGHKEPTQAEQIPCPHMKNIISPLADGTLSGLMLWYAKQHVSGCERCGEALAAMIEIRSQLLALGAFNAMAEEAEEEVSEVSPRLVALWEMMDKMDAETAPVPSALSGKETT